MSFQERYRLQEIISEKEAKVYRAVQVATGKKVLVHQVFGERTPTGCKGIVTLIFQQSLSPAQKGPTPILDMGDFEGHIYVVTEDAEPFLDLRTWLNTHAATKAAAAARPAETKAPAAAQPSVASTAPPSEGASMTHFFAPREILAKDRPAQPPSKAPGEAPTMPAPPDRQGPVASPPSGALDQLFAPSAAPGKPAAPSVPPVAAQPSATSGSRQPGEFTRMFSGMGAARLGEPAQSPARPGPIDASATADRLTAVPSQPPTTPPSPTTTQPAGGAAQEPGEFTRMFAFAPKPAPPPRTDVSPAPVAKPSAAFTPPPAAPTSPASTQAESGDQKEPGSFTQMFFGGTRPTPAPSVSPAGKPGAPEKLAEKATPPTVPQGYEVVFRSRKQPGTEPPVAGVEAPPPAATPPSAEKPLVSSLPPPAQPSQGPGEFTQMFHGRPAQPATPPAVVPRQAPPAPAPSVPPVSEGPGEFTQMFHGRAAPPAMPPGVTQREAPQPPSPPPPARPASESPGEFTNMFSMQIPRKSLEAATRPSPPPQPAAPFSAPPAPSKEPGEFTQMFRAGSVAEKPPERTVAPVPSDLRSSSPAAQQAPGEFTAIMGGYRAPRPTSPMEPPSQMPPAPASPGPRGAQGQSGEFTAMFQAPPRPIAAPPVSPTPVAPPPPPAPAEPAIPSGPGEYTRIISGPPIRSGGPQPAAPPAGAAGAPRAPIAMQPMQVPVMPAMQMQQPVAPMPPQAYIQPGQIQAGPGGVSMQAPQVTPVMPTVPGQFAPAMQPMAIPMAVPQAAPAPTSAPKKRSLLPLIIILGGIFVMTVGLILYFALRH